MFLPRRAIARLLTQRFAEYNAGIREIARRHGCHLFDTSSIPELRDHALWSEDRVHLNSAGHRLLAYRAAEVLGVPDAAMLHGLEHSFHDGVEPEAFGALPWMREHMIPWIWRRLHGRTAGDGRVAKHSTYIELTAAGVLEH